MSGPPQIGRADAGPKVRDVIELLEERIDASRRIVRGQTVRVATTTSTRDHLVEEPLARETVEIERVTIGRVVDTAPEIRQEGDVTIVPVMEEVLVIERRLVLKEEVRMRRVRSTELHRETVTVREQTAVVTRTAADSATPDDAQRSIEPNTIESETP